MGRRDDNTSRQEPSGSIGWFTNYVHQLSRSSAVALPVEGQRFSCPCCRYLTLTERAGFEICPVCFREDDGQNELSELELGRADDRHD